jgi:glycosyltransferase involved in cell wall biosynthesis
VAKLDVLIPTCRRPAALAVTLTSLASQTFRDFDIVISDQTEDSDTFAAGEVRAIARLLELHGHRLTLLRHLPRQGMAEQRQFLLDSSRARFVLFIDDDLLFEVDALQRLVDTLEEQSCGFVGMAPIGLKYRDQVRPHEEIFEAWNGAVEPETVLPDSAAWQRHRLHNAANPLHLQDRLRLNRGDRVAYKVAWIGACVLYDAAKLREAGAYGFWKALPVEHCGEDVLAQLLVARRFGGCGVLPSGVYHQELKTTLPDRRANAPDLLANLLEA